MGNARRLIDQKAKTRSRSCPYDPKGSTTPAEIIAPRRAEWLDPAGLPSLTSHERGGSDAREFGHEPTVGAPTLLNGIVRFAGA